MWCVLGAVLEGAGEPNFFIFLYNLLKKIIYTCTPNVVCNLARILFWVFFFFFSALLLLLLLLHSASRKWSLVMGLWTWSLRKKEISVGEDGEEGKKKEFKEKRYFRG
jgi:hypothetical protein